MKILDEITLISCFQRKHSIKDTENLLNDEDGDSTESRESVVKNSTGTITEKEGPGPVHPFLVKRTSVSSGAIFFQTKQKSSLTKNKFSQTSIRKQEKLNVTEATNASTETSVDYSRLDKILIYLIFLLIALLFLSTFYSLWKIEEILQNL